MGRRAGDLGAVGPVIAVVDEPDWLARWVAESCTAQGVPVKVTDPAVLARVGVLLGARMGGTRAQGASAPSTRDGDRTSQPPMGLDPVAVQRPGTGDTGEDDRVVQDGGDDRGLLFQRQSRPAVA